MFHHFKPTQRGTEVLDISEIRDQSSDDSHPVMVRKKRTQEQEEKTEIKRLPPGDGEEEAKSEFSSFLLSRAKPLHTFRHNHNNKTSQYHIITCHHIMT